jgi:periplasmic protein CpxP/Spy
MVRHIRLAGLIAVVAALVSGGAFVYAQGPDGGGPRGGGPGLGRGGPGAVMPLRDLEVTEAQREQIRQLREQNRTQMQSLFERLRAAHAARRKAVEAVPFNESLVRAAMSELASVEADVAVAEARLQADIYALLTADQQQRLQKLRADREARAKERAQQFQQRQQQRQQRQARPQA